MPLVVSTVALVVSIVALMVAVVGVVAGLGFGLYEAGALGTEVIGANGAANLGVASILCSLIAIPIGFLGALPSEEQKARICGPSEVGGTGLEP